MKVFIGADHRGFTLKEHIKEHLLSRGVEVGDGGAFSLDPQDDYPDFAYRVARAVVREPGSFGILLCGSGMGMDVVANKVRGVRATVGYSRESVMHARAHDDINVLAIAADEVSPSQASAFVNLFLATAFDNAERNRRRLAKVHAVEEREFGA